MIEWIAALAMASTETTAAAPVEKRYCTQFGPFYLRFDPDKAAGFFVIEQNGDLGAVVGVVDDRQFSGEWIEVDSRGRIRIAFSEDWKQFEAEYDLSYAPDQWRSGWVGHLAPDTQTSEMTVDGVQFICR